MRHRFPFFKSDDEDVEINMTPMLDVVFILLIFFIVTTSFVRESGVEVNRPEAQSTAALSQKSVLVAITSDNQIWIDRHQIDVRAVRRNIERLLADTPESTVIIQADKAAQTGVLISVLDQTKLAGATSIAVATSTEK
ncbi:MAG: biopolymer transporter ExbD [Hahellaceae bacterium]|jgi:biopolymer transport protein ExbD|nr:biopolymer transporter ExbD [Hahellaceae bacterium]MCP5211474.1 biopolymer transporter ExbD [Hahellaceae bacterium]